MYGRFSLYTTRQSAALTPHPLYYYTLLSCITMDQLTANPAHHRALNYYKECYLRYWLDMYPLAMQSFGNK